MKQFINTFLITLLSVTILSCGDSAQDEPESGQNQPSNITNPDDDNTPVVPDGIWEPLIWKIKEFDSSAFSFSYEQKGSLTIFVGPEGGSIDIECSNYNLLWMNGGNKNNKFTNNWASVSISKDDRHIVRCLFNPQYPDVAHEDFRLSFGVGDTAGSITFVRTDKIIPNDKILKRFEMKIRINGVPYSGMAHIDENDDFIIEDPTLKEIMDEVGKNKNMIAIIFNSEYVDYLDKTRPDIDEIIKELIKESGSDSGTRATIKGFENMDASKPGYFGLFESSDFSGKSIYTSLKSNVMSYTLQNLAIQNMDNMASSLVVAYNDNKDYACSMLTIWDEPDFNYGDSYRYHNRLSIAATSNNRMVTMPDLSKVLCPGSSKSWNDRISSMSFYFAYPGRQMLDY